MNEKNLDQLISKLKLLHADTIDHLDGSLIDHLRGTYNLLKAFGASEHLCKAGLFHAVYSTSGFKNALVSSFNRDSIRSIIGIEAEKIVYLYCSSDRSALWPNIGKLDQPLYVNRFSGEIRPINLHELNSYCELTVANELEIACENSEFVAEHGEVLRDLFNRMKPFISKCAYKEARARLEY